MEVDYSQQAGLEPISHPQHTITPQQHPGSAKHDHSAIDGHAYSPGWNAVASDPARQERRISGLRPATLALALALLFVILAAGIGGGVGGSLAVQKARRAGRAAGLAAAKNSSCQSTTGLSSPTSTSTFVETTLAWGPVLSTPLPFSGCPKSNNTIYSSINGPQNWRIYCGFDMPGNDLIQTNTPNIELCIETCANWNILFTNTDDKCRGVAFVPAYILGAVSTTPPSDCYLKSNAAVSLLVEKPTAAVEFDSAVVQS